MSVGWRGSSIWTWKYPKRVVTGKKKENQGTVCMELSGQKRGLERITARKSIGRAAPNWEKEIWGT